jgi:hypothetical protein
LWLELEPEDAEGLWQWCMRRMEEVRRAKAESDWLRAGTLAMAAVDHAWRLMKALGVPSPSQKPLVPDPAAPSRAADDAMTFLAECAGQCRTALRDSQEDNDAPSGETSSPPVVEAPPVIPANADLRQSLTETVLAELLSAPDLAERLEQPDSRVESYLRKYRKTHVDCYVRVNNPRKNEPSYLYRTAVVWPVLQAQLPRWRTLGSREERTDE